MKIKTNVKAGGRNRYGHGISVPPKMQVFLAVLGCAPGFVTAGFIACRLALLKLIVVSPFTKTSNRFPAGMTAGLPFLKPQSGAAGQNNKPVTTIPVVTVPGFPPPFVLVVKCNGTFWPSTAVTL